MPLTNIVVALDGSESADWALDLAADIAGQYRARLTLLAVVPPATVPSYGGPAFEPVSQASLEAVYDEVLATRKAKLHNPRIPTVETVRREGVVVEEIVTYLEQTHPDLLVVGSRGLSTGKRLFLGSVSDALTHHAPCPVLVVRHR